MTTFSDTSVLINNNYTYQINNGPYPNGYSNEASAYLQNIVPVELKSFTAAVLTSDVKLEWSTATETNNKGFEIQRTSPLPSPYQGEGGEAGRGWETIGFVPGFGTTTEVHHYSFIDESLQTGNYQYRLKQIDLMEHLNIQTSLRSQSMPQQYFLLNKTTQTRLIQAQK